MAMVPTAPWLSKNLFARATIARSCLSRGFASETSATHAFDRSLKTKQRNNAARAQTLFKHDPEAVNYDYLRNEIAERLVDRLDDIRRDEGFPLALDLGSGSGHIYRAICAEEALQEQGGGIGGVRKLVQIDSAEEVLNLNADDSFEGADRCGTYRMAHDEESKLPFPDGTFDLVISSGSIHWVNDLPKLFSEARRVLKPDGCFMLAMIGGESLSELRASMVLAELEREGGVSPHCGPFVQLSDVGNLMQRAGFALPTLDVDTMKVSFPNAAILMEHLQRMGENNACIKRRERTSLDTFLATACIYENEFGMDYEDEREVELSLQVIYGIGWVPDQSQPKPLERGSATQRMADVVQKHKSG